MARRQSIDVGTLYRQLWQLTLAVLAILVTVSDVARPAASLPFLALAFLLLTRAGERLRSYSRAVGIATLTATAAVAIERGFTFGGVDELPAAMIEVVSGFLPALLTRPARPRSFWLAVLDAAVVAVGCITFTASVLVYVAFMVFVVLLMGLANAATLHLEDTAGARAATQVPRDYFRQFVHVLPAGIFGAGLIFMSFPRVQSFTMSLGNTASKSRTGYSGMIALEGEGEIEESQALALMIAGEDKRYLMASAGQLLLRGDALDSFDGITWTSTVFDYHPQALTAERRIASRHGEEPHILTIHVEPSSNATVFYPDVLLDVLATSPATGELLFNANGSMRRQASAPVRHFYMVRVAPELELTELPATPIATLAAGLRAAVVGKPLPYQLGARDLEVNLKLPERLADAEWFTRWLDEVGVDPETDGVGVAAAALSTHFQRLFKFSLANRFASANALESFLTKERRGHCEYFATATALFWRKLGLPARVAVGYRGGAYNGLIDVLEVREDNAHAWVEVFIPGVGWHAFDPTPSAPPGYGSGFASSLRMWVNAASFYFRRYVIDYDYRAQRDLVNSLREFGSRSKRGDVLSIRDLLVRGTRDLLLGLLAIGLVWLYLRRREAVRERFAAPRWYRALERRLARRGLARAQGETYAAFHHRVAGTAADPTALHAVDAALERELYSGRDLAAEERREARAAAARV